MIALHAARAVAGERILEDAWVTLEGERIAAVGDAPPPGARRIELGEVDLVPGAIDLHSDCLETLAHPRPSAHIPLEAALYDLDALVLAHGITTNYLCISLDDDAAKHRYDERAIETEATLRRIRPALRSEYRIHLRVDVTRDSSDLMRGMLEGGLVALVSYMDHTPGQGQYPEEADWRAFYNSRAGASEEFVEQRLDAKRSGQRRAEAMREQIAALAAEYGAALASHDDDSPAAIERAERLGVAISEFPVNAEAAAVAIARGLGVVMGAPNARRGRSHVTNLSAREALANGTLDALASDYHPPSMFGAAYALAADGACALPRALALVTSGPARIAGLRDRGEIAPGMRADIAAIERRDAYPIVRQTWIAGRPALGFDRTLLFEQEVLAP